MQHIEMKDLIVKELRTFQKYFSKVWFKIYLSSTEPNTEDNLRRGD